MLRCMLLRISSIEHSEKTTSEQLLPIETMILCHDVQTLESIQCTHISKNQVGKRLRLNQLVEKTSHGSSPKYKTLTRNVLCPLLFIYWCIVGSNPLLRLSRD
jgi:hypothetical protein